MATSELPTDTQANETTAPELSSTPESNAAPEVDLDQHSVIFYDGVCGFCDRTIGFVAKRDTNGVLLYAPLQGETAKRLLPESERESMDSVILLTKDGRYSHSAAAVRILTRLGGKWKFLGGLLWLIPKPLRDLGYWCVAKVRYKLFGKLDQCRMPTPEERGRHLE